MEQACTRCGHWDHFSYEKLCGTKDCYCRRDAEAFKFTLLEVCSFFSIRYYDASVAASVDSQEYLALVTYLVQRNARDK